MLKRFSSGRPLHLDDHLKNLKEKLHLCDLKKMDLDDLLGLQYEEYRKIGSFVEKGEG